MKTKGARSLRRVPLVWAHPGREAEEVKLRQVGLTRFPPSCDKLQCPGCGSRWFYVWIDRCRCKRCGLYFMLETANKQPWYHPKNVDQKDQAVICPKCKRNAHYLYEDRFVCSFCLDEYDHALNLIYFWCLEDLGPLRKEAYRQVIGQSGVLKQIKKLTLKTGRQKKNVEPSGVKPKAQEQGGTTEGRA